MPRNRYIHVVLAVVALVTSILACNAPEPATPSLQPAPATVTPYAAATMAPLETAPPPTATPPPPSPTAVPTEEADATVLPTFTPVPTPIPTTPVSEGPLDFDDPHWVHAWRPREGGGVWVTLKVIIRGGAPPFKIYCDGGLNGGSAEREYLLEFPAEGCGQIVHTITVDSADGQSKAKAFWLGGDQLPWCDD